MLAMCVAKNTQDGHMDEISQLASLNLHGGVFIGRLAYNRVKSEFITSLVNFWELQSTTVYAPFIKGKSVDLFKLWQTVRLYGGYERVANGKHWGDVCRKLSFDATPAIASAMSEKYKKILLPYEKFLQYSEKMETPKPELKVNHDKRPSDESDIISCRKCGKTDRKDLLICDGCDFVGAYHMACLDPILPYVPKGKWFCPACFVNNFKLMNKVDEFGFRKSANSYSLQSFGIHADDFKSKYFGKPSHLIALKEVESEFWRLTSDPECDLSVEYGADLNVSAYGSGFPTRLTSRYAFKQYANSPWNLNNFAMNERSALRYLPTDISGMKVPWCYVGMVFSCFCWHTEDHWSFSINYLHRGEPKTWYGVPSASADAFEVAMRQEVPELFERSPDLLHHMTTMLPPSRLIARGVPVFRLNQMAGDFVVTFPRAYHSGFNHGFNFAEAVNFCPASWFSFGRNSIDQYALIHRPPVFSHAELLCRMAESLDALSIDFLVVVTDQLSDLLEKEKSLRRHLARLGVRRTERFVFETCEEELRECMLCKTTLFTSALTCDCSKTMVCLEHYQARSCCSVEDQVMLYRYGLDELSEFIQRPQARLRQYSDWKRRVLQGTQNVVVECRPEGPETRPELSVPCVQPNADVKDAALPKREEVEEGSAPTLPTVDQKELAEEHPKPEAEASSPIFGDSPEDLPTTTRELPTSRPSLSDIQELVAVGRQNHYPTELVRRLESLLETAEECSSVISSIIFHPEDEDYVQEGEDEDNGKVEEHLEATRGVRVKQEEDDDAATRSGSGRSRASQHSSESSLVITKKLRAGARRPATKLQPPLKTRSSTRVQIKKEQDEGEEEEDGEEQEEDKEDEQFRDSIRGETTITGPSVSKLSLSEFARFVSMVSNLPCVIPEARSLERFADYVAKWRTKARSLLELANRSHPCDLESRDLTGADNDLKVDTSPDSDPSVPTVATISQMMQFARAVSIDLPETKRLDRLLECVSWIEKVNAALESQKRPQLEELCDLQLRGDSVAAAIAYTRDALTLNDNNSTSELPVKPALCSESKSPVHSVLDAALSKTSARLLHVIGQARLLEEAVKETIDAKPGSCSLSDAEALVLQAKQLKASFSLSDVLEDLCDQAHKVLTHFQSFEQLLQLSSENTTPLSGFPPDFVHRTKLGTVDSTPRAWLDFFEEVCEAANKLPFKFPPVDHLKQLLTCLDRCHSRIREVFLRPNAVTSNNLLEVLLPRSPRGLDLLIHRDAKLPRNGQPPYSQDDDHDVAVGRAASSSTAAYSSSDGLGSAAYLAACADNANEFLIQLEGGKDFDNLYDAVYSKMIEGELRRLHYLRRSNLTKSTDRDQASTHYCMCRRSGFSGFMLQCELCRDWFHPKCVGFPLKDIDVTRLRYTCPRCERSLRPELSTVIPILEDLLPFVAPSKSDSGKAGGGPRAEQQDASVGAMSGTTSSITSGLVVSLISVAFLLRLPDLAAVQMLCERAFAFARRVRTILLSTPELRRALTQYEAFVGMQMPWNNFSDEVGTPIPAGRVVSSTNSGDIIYHQPSGLSSHDLPPGVRPPGMQPLVLRTSGPRTNYGGRGRPIGSGRGRGAQRGAPEPSSSSSSYVPLQPAGPRRPRQDVDLDRIADDHGADLADTTADARATHRDAPGLYASSSSPSGTKEAEAAVALAGLSAALLPSGSGPGRDQLSPDNFKVPSGAEAARGGPPRASSSSSLEYRSRTGSDDRVSNRADRCPSAKSPGIEEAPNRYFRFRLSTDGRKRLDTLLTEACSLEVNLPQTRWLWQLNLAADTECAGATDPRTAQAEEAWQKQRLLRHLQRHRTDAAGARPGLPPSSRRWQRRHAMARRLSSITVRQTSHERSLHSAGTEERLSVKARSLRRREDIRARREAQRLAAAAHRSRFARSSHPSAYWHSKNSSVRRGVRKRLPSFDDNHSRKRSNLALSPSAYRSAKGIRRSTDPRDPNAGYGRSPAADDRSDYRSQSESPNDDETNWVDILDSHVPRQQAGRHPIPGDRPPSARPASRKGHDQFACARDRDVQFEDSEEEEEGDRSVEGHSDSYDSASALGGESNRGHSPVATAVSPRNYRRRGGGRALGRRPSDDRRRSANYPQDETPVSRHRTGLSRQPRGHSVRRGIESHLTSRGSHKRMALPSRRRKPSSAKTHRVSSASDDESGEDDICTVPGGCLKPRGTVEWVACDRCNAWYHQVCVGIMSVIDVPEVYVCSSCRGKESVPRGITPPTDQPSQTLTTTVKSPVQFRPIPTSGNAKFAAFGGSQFELLSHSRKRRRYSSLELVSPTNTACKLTRSEHGQHREPSRNRASCPTDEWADYSHSSSEEEAEDEEEPPKWPIRPVSDSVTSHTSQSSRRSPPIVQIRPEQQQSCPEGNMPPRNPIGTDSSFTGLSHESAGAEALLQAIEVLDAQPDA
ncbi:demethylase [Sparganum proliferum]